MPDTPEQNLTPQQQNLQPSPAQPETSSPTSSPINPNLENVQLNQKKPQQAPQPPVTAVPTVPAPSRQSATTGPAKVMGKPRKNSADDKKRFLIGCSGGFLGLFVIFIILMVLVLSRAGADNAVLQAFNLSPSNLRRFLLGVVGLSFGGVSLLLLVMTAIGIFRFSGAKKEDQERRKSGIKLTLFSFFPLLAVIAIWLFLFNFINNLSLQAEVVPAQVTVVSPADLTNLEAPVEITFSALDVAQNLKSSDLAIERMEWDLDGDGEYETPVRDPEVVQLYNRRGFYTVSLRAFVTGEEEPRIYQKPIDIQQATFKTTPNSGTAPLTVRFDAADLIPANMRIESFDWDFDGDAVYDLESDDAEQAEYTFSQIGDYEVHLRMINVNGNVENYYKTIQVGTSQDPLIEAKIDATPAFEGTLPFQVQFSADRSSSLKGTVTRYTWNFGDGSAVANGRSVSHVYQQAGTFTVELTVEDDLGNQDQEVMEVLVSVSTSAPQAIITTTPAFDVEFNQLTGDAPLKVTFEASNSTDRDDDIVEYAWDFDGDDEPDELGEKVVDYTFPEPGEFEVKLNVEDAQGQVSESTLLISVTQPPLLAVIEAQPQEGTPPLVVNFDGSSSRAFEGEIVSYEWNFGDGTASTITGAVITHQYTKVGNFTASLKVTADNGETAQVTFPVFIREIPLEACFTPSRKQGVAPLGVSFNVQCSTGTIAQYDWNFGDGSTASSFNPSHTFESPGVYTVTLTISDSKNNVSTFSDVITAQGEL